MVAVAIRTIPTLYGEVRDLYRLKKSHSEVSMVPWSVVIIMLLFEPAPLENNALYSLKSTLNK